MKRAEFGAEPEDAERSVLKNDRGVAPTPKPSEAQEFIAEHTVKADETLSHIALKYYGSSVTEKWMAIYEANKPVIGENPSAIRPGMVLKIPKLTA
jgi:nucleoid-associated protein YgaU